jgi:hypothetical protein
MPLGAATRLVLTGLLVTSALLLSACGGQDDPVPDPTSTTSSSTSTSDDPSESGSGSASGSAAVTPATGELVETKAFAAHVPEGWQVDVVSKDFVIVAHDPDRGNAITFNIIDTGGNELTLDQLAADAVQTGSWPGKTPSVVAETELGGEPAYHLIGSGGGVFVDARGTVHGSDAVSVDFEDYRSDTSLQSTVESVLASWQWK